MTDVTPEMLRAVADWIDDRGAQGELRDIADKLERQQAEEKRINELADVFSRASGGGCPLHLAPEANSYRAGIRAVLAKLDEEPRA